MTLSRLAMPVIAEFTVDSSSSRYRSSNSRALLSLQYSRVCCHRTSSSLVSAASRVPFALALMRRLLS